MSRKIKRIESDILKYVNQIILTEILDETVKNITITGVDVTSDISLAKIYFTHLSKDKEEITTKLNDTSSFIRMHLAKLIDLRHTPKLLFVYDESIEYGANIEKIIKDIKK